MSLITAPFFYKEKVLPLKKIYILIIRLVRQLGVSERISRDRRYLVPIFLQ